MCILQQATNISWWGRIFHGGVFDALTGAKFSQLGRIFRANISPGAKYTQQGGDKYRGAILIHDTGPWELVKLTRRREQASRDAYTQANKTAERYNMARDNPNIFYNVNIHKILAKFISNSYDSGMLERHLTNVKNILPILLVPLKLKEIFPAL